MPECAFMPHSARVLWLFGLPSAGKTSLGTKLRERLRSARRLTVLLDGDELRVGVSSDLGDSDLDRTENLRRAACMAKTLYAQGVNVIAAFTTPQESQREMVREILGDAVKFIHVDCPLDVSIQRDTKGLYTKALLEGQSPRPARSRSTSPSMRNAVEDNGMTGLQSPFESPVGDVLRVTTNELSLQESADFIWEKLFRQQNKTEPDEIAAVEDDEPLPAQRALTRVIVLGSLVIVSFATLLIFAWNSRKTRAQDNDVARMASTNNARPGDQPGTLAHLTPTIFQEDSPSDAWEIYTPTDATTILEEGKALMASFWKAPTWREKLPLVRQPDRVAPRLVAFYESKTNREPRGAELRTHLFQKLHGTETLHMAFAAEGQPLAAPVVVDLLRQPDGAWRLDWESMVGAGDMPWEDFIKKRSSQPIVLRARVMQDNYHGYEFDDAARFLGVRLESADAVHSLNAYCEKNSPLADRARLLLTEQNGAPLQLTVRVAFPPAAQSDRCVRLLEIVSDRWLVP